MSDNSEVVRGQVDEGPEMAELEQPRESTPGAADDSGTSDKPRVVVDPRGQRFSAAISVVVLAVVLVAGVTSELSAILLTVQGVAFGLGGMFGLRFQPYGWFYRAVIRPRLGAPAEYEDEAPPRFAQLVGFIFIVVALIGVVTQLAALAYVAVGFALAAAFLNAAFGFCLGCQFYLMFKRVTSK